MTEAARLGAALLGVLCSVVAGGQLTGRQVMEKARQVNQPDDETVVAEMTLAQEGGRKVRRVFRLEYLRGDDGLDRMLIRFFYPRRMKGTGLLTIERKGRPDDQWLYLPSLRRIRRIGRGLSALSPPRIRLPLRGRRSHRLHNPYTLRDRP